LLVPDAFVFSDYGCYCGAAGRVSFGPYNGGTPVDATDSCCLQHDLSWVNAPAGCDCGEVKYNWKCNKQDIGSEAVCKDQKHSECAAYCCEEDVKFSHCLQAAASTQNNKKFWDWSDMDDHSCCGSELSRITNTTLLQLHATRPTVDHRSWDIELPPLTNTTFLPMHASLATRDRGYESLNTRS